MLKYGVNTDPHFSLIITFAVHDLFQSVTMPWVYVFMTFVTANVTTFVKCSADPCCSPSVRIIFSYSNYTEFFLCFLLAPIHISSQGLALWWVWVCMHDWDEWRNKVPVNIGQSTNIDEFREKAAAHISRSVQHFCPSVSHGSQCSLRTAI